MKYIKLFENNKIPEFKIGNDYIVLDEDSIFEFFDTGNRCVFWFTKNDTSKFVNFLEDKTYKISHDTYPFKTNQCFYLNIGDYEISRYPESGGIRISEDDMFRCFFDKKYMPDLIEFLKNPTFMNDTQKYNL